MKIGFKFAKIEYFQNLQKKMCGKYLKCGKYLQHWRGAPRGRTYTELNTGWTVLQPFINVEKYFTVYFLNSELINSVNSEKIHIKQAAGGARIPLNPSLARVHVAYTPKSEPHQGRCRVYP